MSDRGQALVEYALITLILLGGVVFTKNTLGTYWPQILDGLGLYSIYTDSYDLVLSLPIP